MKSITIHNLDDRVSKKLSELSSAEGLSLNKTIKKILDTSLGLFSGKGRDHKEDFSEFRESWSQEEGRVFGETIREFKKINPEDWE